jgi:hypothetical protein
VRQPDHAHVHQHPRRIEHGQQPLCRERRAHGADVAQRAGFAGGAAPRRLRHGQLGHHRRQRLGDDVARHPLQAPAQVVEREQHRQPDAGAQRQYQQRVATAADQHPVEHLQHEDRRDQHQQVDEEGKARDVEQRAFEELEQGLHGCASMGEPGEPVNGWMDKK